MSRAVMQQALDVLEAIGGEWGFISKSTVPKRIEVITALRIELDRIPDAGKMAGPERQPLTDEVHNAFLQGIRYAANKYEVVSDEMFTGGDVSNFLLMEAEELDSSDITRAIETSNGIKEQA
jgi:hypothetical protein